MDRYNTVSNFCFNYSQIEGGN